MEERRLQANGLGFRCLASGPASGELVLLLHGFPEGAESWVPQLERLDRAGFRAVAPDLRGYGGTDCPELEDAYRWPHLVADVEGLLLALGRERCHLAGHDWGSLVGWSVASRRPDRVLTWSALSVGHPVAFQEAIRLDEDQRRRSEYVNLFRIPGKAERVLAEDDFRRLRAMYRLGPLPDAIPEEVVDGWVRGFARPGRLTAALNYYRVDLADPPDPSYPAAPVPILAPTQMIWGDQDPAVGRLSTERTAAHVAGPYRQVVVEGAGHWLQFEKPDEISARLVEWMSG
jgi:pimeloyl-ACP methyl ester carboxylesterase